MEICCVLSGLNDHRRVREERYNLVLCPMIYQFILFIILPSYEKKLFSSGISFPKHHQHSCIPIDIFSHYRDLPSTQSVAHEVTGTIPNTINPIFPSQTIISQTFFQNISQNPSHPVLLAQESLPSPYNHTLQPLRIPQWPLFHPHQRAKIPNTLTQPTRQESPRLPISHSRPHRQRMPNTCRNAACACVVQESPDASVARFGEL